MWKLIDSQWKNFGEPRHDPSWSLQRVPLSDWGDANRKHYSDCMCTRALDPNHLIYLQTLTGFCIIWFPSVLVLLCPSYCVAYIHYLQPLSSSIPACPPGTYKPEGTPGGPSTCLPCPDLEHTSQPGSTSVSDCVCKPGYYPIGMTCQSKQRWSVIWLSVG